MEIEIHNCNNVLNGKISLVEGALNIKYAINGTGKSTIAKAIQATCSHDDNKLNQLKPYRYIGNEDKHNASVSGIDSIEKVMTFDENYINQYVFQPDELLRNSYEIFVKTPNYDENMEQINHLLSEIGNTFQTNPEFDELIMAFSKFLDGCGKNSKSLAASGSIVKGLGKGNKIDNIPEGLEPFQPYLGNTHDGMNVKWLKWHADGQKFLDISEQCPFCAGTIQHTKDQILKVSEEYNTKSVEHLDEMLSLFAQLKPYFSEDTALQMDNITENAGNMSNEQKNYLVEVKRQISTIYEQLTNLKQLSFKTLKDTERVADIIKNYKIDLALLSHLQSEKMRVKVDVINSSLDEVLEKAGELQGKVNIQNKQIQGTIKENSTEINAFMKCAGYEYTVLIEESTNYNYRMILKPVGYDTEITSVKDHLSYGERNALALALFMFSAIKENPDLIILDDPISSFDGNKKFALLDMLFMSKKCIRDRTVLLLTHDFNTIIDTIYTLPRKFHPVPHGAFLSTKDGQLEEKQILKKDIQSYRKITVDNIAANIDSLNKLIYLRRFLEAEGNKGMAWQLLSNLFHKREIPEIHETESKSLTEQEQLATTEQANDKEPIPMTEPQQMEATTEIRKYVKDFDYSTELAKAQNNETLVNLYTKSTSNYEKLQLYRILHNENNENDVVRKFVNETFHAENDSLFQLNPREFDTIPQYIIDECDKEMIV